MKILNKVYKIIFIIFCIIIVIINTYNIVVNAQTNNELITFETYNLTSSSIPDDNGESWYDTGTSLPHAVDYEDNSLLKYLRQGDILYEGSGSLSLTGHTAIVEGIYFDETYNQYYVRLIESASCGVVRSILTPTRFRNKKVEIYRLNDASSDQIDGAIDFMVSQLGKDYQLVLTKNPSSDNENWYCSELVWAAFYWQEIFLDNDDNNPNGSVVTPREIRDYRNAVLIMHYEHETICSSLDGKTHAIVCNEETYIDNHEYKAYNGYNDKCYICDQESSDYTSNNEIILNCRTNLNNIQKQIEDDVVFWLITLNVDCTKSYNFIMSSTSKLNISLYNFNNELIETNKELSNNDCTTSLNQYLPIGIYYLKISFVNMNYEDTVNLKYKAIWPTDSYQVLCNKDNDILSHLHKSSNTNASNTLYYINNLGPGMYKFILNATLNDEEVVYPTGAIKVYDYNNNYQEYKYNVFGYFELAQNKNNESNFYMYLSRSGYYYVRINMPLNDYLSMNFRIEKVINNQEIGIKERMLESFTLNLINNETSKEYVKSITIDRPIKVRLNGEINNTLLNNIIFILFQKKYNVDTNTYYTIDKYAKTLTNNDKIINQEIVLEQGTYYICYFNNIDKANINLNITRIVQNNLYQSLTIVADPGEGYTYGSEVRYNNGIYGGNTITEGFTRHLFFALFENYVPSCSRIQYSWYSSNNDIAIVTSYGTVLAQNVSENSDVIIYSIYNIDPSIIFIKELRILKELSSEVIDIVIDESFSYVNNNGIFEIELNDINSPYPWIQDYTWSVNIPCQENDISATIDLYGKVNVSSKGYITIIGIYNRNPRVRIIFNLTVTE